jgi:hypothetical protein
LNLVWVTDYRRVERLTDDVHALADRLGMSFGQGDRLLFLVYNRSQTNGRMCVPRCFDAVDSPGFRIVVSCSAAAGKTRSLTRPAKEGLPEAVHRSCGVVPLQFEMRSPK